MESNPQQLCDDLLALMGVLKHVIAKVAEEHNMTPQQVHALYAIMEGEATMGRLATALHCDASNVTGIVDRLVARRFITSEASTRDRRAKILKVEDSGAHIIDDFMNALPEYFNSMNLTTRECGQLHSLITKIAVAEQARSTS